MGDVKEYLSNTTAFWIIPTVSVWMQSFCKKTCFDYIGQIYGIRKGRGYGVKVRLQFLWIYFVSLWSHKPRERWQQCPEEPLFVSGTEADNCVFANKKMIFIVFLFLFSMLLQIFNGFENCLWATERWKEKGKYWMNKKNLNNQDNKEG